MNQLPVGNRSDVGAEPGDIPCQQKTILIADDDPVVVNALSQRLQHLGYRTVCSTDATHALLEIEKTHPDLAILDIQMPSGNGLAVCEMLACNRACAGIPIVVHSVLADEAVKRRCRQLGTHYVEKSPRSAKEVETLVESLLSEHQTLGSESNVPAPLPLPEDSRPAESSPKTALSRDRQLHCVLCVDDDPVIIRSVAIRLQPYGVNVKGIDNGAQGYLQAAMDPPDLILLDLNMPSGAGDYALEQLKGSPTTKDIPVIVLTMEATAGIHRQMSSLGADGFLTKPVHWPALFAEMGRYVQLPRQLLIDYNLSEYLADP
jgi:CheY-like chemotaxis protein